MLVKLTRFSVYHHSILLYAGKGCCKCAPKLDLLLFLCIVILEMSAFQRTKYLGSCHSLNSIHQVTFPPPPAI